MKSPQGSISTETRRLAIEAIDQRIKMLMPEAAQDTGDGQTPDAYGKVTQLFEARAELARSLGSAQPQHARKRGAAATGGTRKGTGTRKTRRSGLPHGGDAAAAGGADDTSELDER